MKNSQNILAAGVVLLACGLPVGLLGADAAPANVTAAVGSFARPMVEVTRDAQLKPADLLTFSEVKPGQAVVDFIPGDGYWTHLLSKAVGTQGHVYALVPIRGYRTLPNQRTAEAAAAKAAGKPAPVVDFDRVLPIQFIVDFKNVKAISESIDWFGGNFGIPEQADVVFTANNAYHDFHNRVPGDTEMFKGPYNMDQINKSIFRAMKPGGLYVIADNTAAPGAGFTATDSLKRVDPEALKTEMTSAGFEFAGSSDIYANPADDHTKPADAKSDRFVMKFRKPRTAPATDNRPKGVMLATWKKNWFGNTFYFGGTAETYTTGMYYHADGTVQETGGNPNSTVLYGTYYWDADGHNCQYHESANSQGFVVCHAMPKEALLAKPGDSWSTMGGTPDARPGSGGLLKGMVYAKPRAGRGGGAAAPAATPAATPPPAAQ